MKLLEDKLLINYFVGLEIVVVFNNLQDKIFYAIFFWAEGVVVMIAGEKI
jgi:hypothetical protein